MFSRSCRRFSGRSDRPGGRRRQDPPRRRRHPHGRPASALRGDPRPERRAASFGDRPAENPGADSMFSRPCGRFSGRSDRPAAPRRRTRQSERRHPQVRPAWDLRGDPRPERRPASFGDRPAEISGADSMFSMACGRFSGRSGDRNSRGVAFGESPLHHASHGPPPRADARGRKGRRRLSPPWSECGMGEGDRPKDGGGGRAATGLGSCGRSQRPCGRWRQDSSKRAPSSQRRPASALRGDRRPGRRPASFGDRPAENPGADSMFSRPCGRFSGRSDRPGGRRRQDPSRRAPSPHGRPASASRGDPRPERRPASFGDRPAENPGADSMFSRPCGRFSGRSGDRNSRGVPPSARAPSTMLRMVPLPRADARGRKGRRRLSSPVERMRNGGGGPSEGRWWGPRRDGAWELRAIATAVRALAPGLVKARAVIPTAPGLGVTGRCPTGATARALR